MTTYKTSQVAKIIGIHPNTVRLYEELQLIPPVQREKNGYRVFTDYHVDQFKLARLAFQVEILQNGLRKKMIQIVKSSAHGEFDKAIQLTNSYIQQVIQEESHAKEVIQIVHDLLSKSFQDNQTLLKRQEVSNLLNITMDTLRNWEMNGLIQVKRKANGYRVYTDEDINRLKIIRSLRCANYSLTSILRMLNAFTDNPNINIKEVIGQGHGYDDIVTACDNLLISLKQAKQNAEIIYDKLNIMKSNY